VCLAKEPTNGPLSNGSALMASAKFNPTTTKIAKVPGSVG